jgi:DNA-binding NarL/FixJ family response regulator
VSISVLLADDQPLLRRGFRMIIEAEGDLTVIAEAGNGDEAVGLARTSPPDVVLMDIRMPGCDGIEATRRIIAANSGVRVLVLTTFDLDEYAFGALRAGASGFLLKDVHPAELVAAIRTVASGNAVVSPRVAACSRSTRRRPRCRPGSGPTATRSCPRSPNGSTRCSRRWPAACPTPRSPPPCTCPRRR